MNKLSYLVLVTLFLAGCRAERDPPAPRIKTEAHAQTYLLNADDFDLGEIISLVKDNKVAGGEDLEKLINADNGINNVDLDHNQKIDYVSVVESRGDGIILDFVAHPSSGPETTIATIKFNKTADQIQVTGGYPDYVRGNQDRYYSYSSPAAAMATGVVAGALFTSWLYSPSHTVYVAPVPVYRPRTIYTPVQVRTQRTTLQTQTRVAPIVETRKPPTFTSSPSAQKVQKAAQPLGSTFESRAGKTQLFRERDSSVEKKRATGFGATPSAPPPSSGWGKSSASKPSSWGSAPAPSKPSSSWGSSSASKPKSSSASKPKSSWGSSSKKK